MNPIHDENKVEKSLRNSEAFQTALARAIEGDYDKELSEARDQGELEGTTYRLPLLKVTELFTIRKRFSLSEGKDYYQLYKEKFYLENPGSNYFETVNNTVYRTVVMQKEKGDIDWAEAVSAKLGIAIQGEEDTEEPQA